MNLPPKVNVSDLKKDLKTATDLRRKRFLAVFIAYIKQLQARDEEALFISISTLTRDINNAMELAQRLKELSEDIHGSLWLKEQCGINYESILTKVASLRGYASPEQLQGLKCSSRDHMAAHYEEIYKMLDKLRTQLNEDLFICNRLLYRAFKDFRSALSTSELIDLPNYINNYYYDFEVGFSAILETMRVVSVSVSSGMKQLPQHVDIMRMFRDRMEEWMERFAYSYGFLNIMFF